MTGLKKLLMGCLKYQSSLKSQFKSRLDKVNKNPSEYLKGLMFSCMDSRVNVPSFISQELGESFHVRNAGNLIPHFSTVSQASNTTEPAALELACITVGVPDVVVFGHADCKAMIALLSTVDSTASFDHSPLMRWLQKHGAVSLSKFKDHVKTGGLVKYQEAHQSFEAQIDDKLELFDKLSQINTLQQLENISSYPFIVERLMNGSLRTHAVWLDIVSADVFVFNRSAKKFEVVTNQNMAEFM